MSEIMKDCIIVNHHNIFFQLTALDRLFIFVSVQLLREAQELISGYNHWFSDGCTMP